MGTIFKSIGKGILYILIAPFYVLGLLLIALQVVRLQTLPRFLLPLLQEVRHS